MGLKLTSDINVFLDKEIEEKRREYFLRSQK